jgi:hypothetical protein
VDAGTAAVADTAVPVDTITTALDAPGLTPDAATPTDRAPNPDTAKGIDTGNLGMGAEAGSPDGLGRRLIAYYPFNGGAKDESGNGNDGTVQGATPTADRFGHPNSAYSFSGTSGIFIPGKPTIRTNLSSMSIACWINVTSIAAGIPAVPGEGYAPIVDRSNYAANDEAWQLYLYGKGTDTGLNGGFSSSGTDPQGYCPIGTNLGTLTSSSVYMSWAFLTLTNDGRVTRLYLNANLISENACSGGGRIWDSASEIGIGARRYPGTNNGYFQGQIDDVRLYEGQLSQREIEALYQEGGWTGP